MTAALNDVIRGGLLLAPITKGSNLPYRRLCQEFGACLTMSEMAVARRLKQDRRNEFALIRRAPDERFFGVQLAGNNPEEMAWAAALVESRGADLVDVNLGCPIDYFTSKGLGAALAREPRRVHRIVAAMKSRVTVPVTVKIRLGWTEDRRNYLDVARAAVDAGADAIVVHGRTRAARYTMQADWRAIGEVVRAVPVPVIGNGDLLFRRDIDQAFAESGCAAVMTARGALIKPWIFREASAGDWEPSAEARVAIYRRYVALAREHWGSDERGVNRLRDFLVWHVAFWARYVPRHADGSYPSMQVRQSWTPRSPLEALLARADRPAHEYITSCLLQEEELDPALAPPPTAAAPVDDDMAEAG